MATVTADSKTIIENLAKRGNRHAIWALAEVARLTAELEAARELLAEIEFQISSNYPTDSIKEAARKIDDHLWDVGYRK